MKVLLRVYNWFSVPANRKRVYTALMTLGSAMVAAEVVTPEFVSKWVLVAGILLSVSGHKLASANVDHTKVSPRAD